MIVCIAGQTFIVVQQQSNANNTSLSPHYGNSVPATPDSAQSFANVNWPHSEHQQEDYHKNINGISDKLGISGGRRTPYNSIDLPNGSIYHSFNESQINGNSINNSNNMSNNNQNNNSNNNIINNNNNNNTNTKANSKTSITSNANSSNSFTPTTTYSTNQSQSFASPPNHDYSTHDSNSLPNTMSGRQTQRPSSRSSPARAVINSSNNSGNKSNDTEPMVTISANGVNSSQSHLNNEQNLENEPFLVNTTTTMHHLSDLTTSMNTSTGMH